jgi:hypothetical protein
VSLSEKIKILLGLQVRNPRVKFYSLPYSIIFQLCDGGQFSLVEERSQIHSTMYLGRDHLPSASKLTNFLTHRDRLKRDSVGMRPRGMRRMSFNHSATEGPNNPVLL